MKLKEKISPQLGPILTLLACLSIMKAKETIREEEEITNPRKHIKIKQTNNPYVLKPLVLLDTGAQVTCMDNEIFKQLRIPQAELKPKKRT